MAEFLDVPVKKATLQGLVDVLVLVVDQGMTSDCMELERILTEMGLIDAYRAELRVKDGGHNPSDWCAICGAL